MLYSSSWKSLYVMLPFLPFSDSLYFFSLTTSKTPFQPLLPQIAVADKSLLILEAFTSSGFSPNKAATFSFEVISFSKSNLDVCPAVT